MRMVEWRKYVVAFPVFFGIFYLSSFSVCGQNTFYDASTVSEVRINFTQTKWAHMLDSMIQAGTGDGRLEADVSVNGVLFEAAGVRYKGYSSWNAGERKNPFNIDLDYTVPNRNYMGFTKLKLSNVIHDPSFVREVLSYEIVRKYMQASLAGFARVYVNDTLIGLYTNVETVDKDFAERHFGSRNHSFFKGSPADLEFPFGENANLAYTHGPDSTGYFPYYQIESDYGWSDLLHLIYALNEDTIDLENILNIDQTLWMHALNYTILNLDSYIGYSQNYYLYMDDNRRFNPIIWDMNMSFGSFRNTDATALSLTISKMKQIDPLQHLYKPTFSPRPLTKNLFTDVTQRQMYLAHMRTIVNENIRNGDYLARGIELQSIIDQDVQDDTNKFYSYTDFSANLTTDVGSVPNQYPGIRELMEARMAYLDTFPGFKGEPQIIVTEHLPLRPAQNGTVSITARVNDATEVVLGYRFKTGGSFTKMNMVDDGSHNDGVAGDSIYGAELTFSGYALQYFIWAENDSAGVFFPERAEFEYCSIQPEISQGDIVINEISDSWIEIYNNTNETYNMSGVFLGDDVNTCSWPFPDTSIAGHSFMMLATANSSAEGISSSLEIAAEGGKLFLAYNNDLVIDMIGWGELPPNRTYGRYPNGIGAFTSMKPSYAINNYPGTVDEYSVLLYPNPASGYITIELGNSNQPVQIEILNSSGQLMQMEYIEPESDDVPVFLRTIDVSPLRKGIYFIKTVCDDRILMARFVII